MKKGCPMYSSRLLRCSTFFAVLLLCSVASAQDVQAAQSTLSAISVPVPSSEESLHIGPGDILHVQVLDTQELEQRSQVTDAGTLPLILGGIVSVVGLTPQDAARAVATALKRGNYMLDPHVVVTIERYATQNVSVLGQVHLPGRYSVETPRTLADVLALAGGLSEIADRHVTIEDHATHQRKEVFVFNDASRFMDNNPLVYPGDIVYIPKAPIIYVLGDVNRAGGFPVATNNSSMTALQVLSLAGGTRPSAVPSHTHLIRKQADGTYHEMSLNIARMQKGREPDTVLQADDIIYIPFSYLRNMAVNINQLVSATAGAAIYQF
jgi:polysaccharide export outer membrane protein